MNFAENLLHVMVYIVTFSYRSISAIYVHVTGFTSSDLEIQNGSSCHHDLSCISIFIKMNSTYFVYLGIFKA